MRVPARLAIAAAGVLAVGLASGASAAPVGPKSLTFPDASGDSTKAAADITGVTFTTSGTGKGKTYVPKNLVLTMTLAAPPSSDGTTLYEIDADMAGCGDFYVSWAPGSIVLDPSFNLAGCGSEADATGDESTSFDGAPEVKGNSIVWTFSLKGLPAPAKAGTVFSGLNALTDLVDPAFGTFGPGPVTGPFYDTAETDKSYTVG